MRRKVSQIGPSSLMISLPSKWVKKHAISKGDELEIREQAHQLLISTTSEEPRSQLTSIVLEDTDVSTAGRLFRLAYRTGADEIHLSFEPTLKGIHGESVDAREFIMKMVDEYVGVELMELNRSSCTIKEITCVKKEELEPVMHRIIFAIVNNSSALSKALATVDKESLQNLATIADRGINRLSEYCNRILGKYRSEYADTSMYLYRTILNLERLGDRVKFIATNAQKASHKKALAQFAEKLHAIVEQTQKAFLSIDHKKLTTANTLRLTLLNDINKITKTEPAEQQCLIHIREALFLCADIIEDRFAMERFLPAQSWLQENQ